MVLSVDSSDPPSTLGQKLQPPHLSDWFIYLSPFLQGNSPSRGPTGDIETTKTEYIGTPSIVALFLASATMPPAVPASAATTSQ